MNYKLACIACALVLLPILAASQSPISSAINKFSMEMHDSISEKGNLISSPISAWSLLAMISRATNGPTFEQIRKAIHLESNSDDSQYNDGFRDLAQRLNINQEYSEVKLANKIYYQYDIRMKGSFYEKLHEFYLTKFQKINFANSDNATSIINKWVENQTNNKITDLIEKGGLRSDTKIVFVNSLYFRCSWKDEFQEGNLDFTVNGESVNVPSIYGRSFDGRYKELNDLGVKMVEIPLTGPMDEEPSIVIVLPNTGVSLVDVEKKLKNQGLPQIYEMHKKTIDLSLPKFKISSKIDLKETLQKLNIIDLFESPDFSKMTSTLGLNVDTMVQKAVIEVNKNGIEAAAASAGSIVPLMGIRRPVEVIVNRNFLVFIRTPDEILFSGRIVDPTLE